MNIPSNKKILITGATGFIGRHLAKKLADSNNLIFCVVRKTSNTALLPSQVKLIYADITDPKSLDKIHEKIDYIFHCAAYVNDKNRKKLFNVNVYGTQNICELALKLGIERMIYLSSVAVVAGNTQTPLTEDLPYCATNIYGESKIAAEKIVIAYRKAGLKVAIVRPPMIYGEGEPHMMKKLLFFLRHRLLFLINNGNAKQHLAYVSNVVDAMTFALTQDKCLSKPFFVADSEVLTFNEITSIMAKAMGAKPPLNLPTPLTPILTNIPYFGKKLKFFLKDRVYSIERLASFGFKPSYSIEKSLMHSVKSFMEN